MNLKNKVERQTGVALWRQIADRIRQAISHGDYDAMDKLPPETILAEQFDVNRHTVRSALASLADEGIVQAIQGRGTMILRKERLSFPISKRTRFSQGLGDQARNLEARLLAHDRVEASREIATALQIDTGSACIRLETLSSADGRPVSCGTSWFPANRFPDIAADFERLGSITKAFAVTGLADYVRVSTEIVACHADAGDLARLRLSPGAIILEAQAINTDLQGVPVQHSRTRFAADRVKLKIET